MVECLRPRPAPPTLVLRCYRCGLIRDIEDDGRRVHQAHVHVSSCPQPAAESSQPELRLVSSDHLELKLSDGTTWLQIRRE
jgi:uncharacterized C2H2 Zn-finger protein